MYRERTEKRRKVSAKSCIVIIIMLYVVPIILFLFWYNVYAIEVMNTRLEETNKSSLYFFQDSFEKSLSQAEDFIATIIVSDSTYHKLSTKLQPLELELYAQETLDKYRTLLNTNELVSGIFIHSGKNNLFYKIYNKNYSHEIREETEQYLRKMLNAEADERKNTWFAKKIGNEYFLFRIFGNQDASTVCMIDFNNAVSPQKLGTTESFMMYTDNEGNPLTYGERAEKENIVIDTENNSYYITGNPQYFVVQSFFDKVDINCAYLVRYKGFLHQLDRTQVLFLVASIVIVLLIALSFGLLELFFFRPLKKFNMTMGRIKQGEFDIRMKSDYKLKEFQELSITLNDMLDEIHKLKIEKYEKELRIQKTHMQLLQIQIRPHFVLNCMKNLYAMAEQREIDKLQEMILRMSDYLRVMFRENMENITIKDEIKNVYNYIGILQISSAAVPKCQVSMDEGVEDFMIPSLSVLTFVENAVKHGFKEGKDIVISIKVTSLNDGINKCLNISISDNGVGFSKTVIEKLNTEDEEFLKEHMGIINVKKRISYLYPNSSFLFDNLNGAHIEIFIPY